MQNLAKIIIVIILCLLMMACEVFGVRGSEEAAHVVLYEEDSFQVREYQPVLMAATTVKGDFKDSRNQAFKRLAGYIFGENQSADSIAMTTPVLEEKQSEKIAMTVPVFENNQDDEWIMTFVLPAKYSMDTLPKPNDEQVKIIQAEKRIVATVSYSGFINSEKMSNKSQALKEWIDKQNYIVISEPYSAAYDLPWTIPFLRTNEVQIEIEMPAEL